MGASQLLSLKQSDPDAYRAALARIERQRLGAPSDGAQPEGGSPWGRARSLDSLLSAFQAQAAGDIGTVRAARLSDIKRGLIYACTGLRATMLSGLPLRLYRMDAKADGQRLDLKNPLSRLGKPAMVRGQRLTEAGEVTAVDSAPLLTKLGRPNQDWTGRRLILATETSLCLAGEAFWHFPFNPGSRPVGIDYLKHDRMSVVRPGKDDPKHRTVAGWKIDKGTADEKPARADEVLRFAYFDPEDPDYGALAPAQVAALGSDAYHAAMKSNADIFAKGMRGKGFVTPPEEMESLGWEQIEEVQANFDNQLRGSGNNHNLAVMPYRYGVQRLDVSAKDAEFLGLLEFAIEDAARAFSIPIEMVGGTRRTYQNNQAADAALWQRCLAPESAWIADELTRRLCPAFGLDESYFLGFDLCDVVALQDDESLRWARDKEAISSGALRVNEWRKTQGMEELPESSALRVGDVNAAIQVAAMMGIGQLSADQATGLLVSVVGLSPAQAATIVADGPPVAEETTPTPEPATDDDTRSALTRALAAAIMGGPAGRTVEFGSARHVEILDRSAKAEKPHASKFEAAVDGLFSRQRDSLMAKLGERSARDGGGAAAFTVEDLATAFNYRKWIKEFRTRMLPLYRDASKDAGTLILKTVGADTYFKDTAAPVLSAMRGRSQKMASQVNDTTWDALTRALAAGTDAGEGGPDLVKRVGAVLGETARAAMIARTETHGAFEESSLLAVKQASADLGLDYEREWVSALDDRVRPDHQEAHGQRVGLDEEFEVGGQRGSGPGNMGDAANDANCRCTAIYVPAGSERAVEIGALRMDATE